MIPTNWKKKTLSHVAHIQTGIAKGAKERGLMQKLLMGIWRVRGAAL